MPYKDKEKEREAKRRYDKNELEPAPEFRNGSVPGECTG